MTYRIRLPVRGVAEATLVGKGARAGSCCGVRARDEERHQAGAGQTGGSKVPTWSPWTMSYAGAYGGQGHLLRPGAVGHAGSGHFLQPYRDRSTFDRTNPKRSSRWKFNYYLNHLEDDPGDEGTEDIAAILMGNGDGATASSSPWISSMQGVWSCAIVTGS